MQGRFSLFLIFLLILSISENCNAIFIAEKIESSNGVLLVENNLNVSADYMAVYGSLKLSEHSFFLEPMASKELFISGKGKTAFLIIEEHPSGSNIINSVEIIGLNYDFAVIFYFLGLFLVFSLGFLAFSRWKSLNMRRA